MKFAPSDKRRAPSLLFVALFFAGLFLVVHNPSLDRNFMLDDHVYLTGKLSYVRISPADVFLSIKSRHYAPLNFAVNIALFRTFELSPFLLHGINLFLFYLGTLTLYQLARQLASPPAAWLTALVYALHPVNADMFGMVFMNSVLLMNLLLLGSLSLYVNHENTRRRFAWIASLLLFGVALFLQELSVLLPAAVFLLSWIYFKRSLRQSLVTSAPYAVMTIAFLALWFYVSSQTAAIGSHYQGLQLGIMNYIGYQSQLMGWYWQVLGLLKDPVFIYNVYTKAAAPVWIWTITVPAIWISAFAVNQRCLKSRVGLFGLLLFLVGFMPALPGSLAHSYMGMVIEPYWFVFTSVGFFLFIGEALAFLFAHLSRRIKLAVQIMGLFILIVSTVHVHYAGRYEKRYSEYWLKQAPYNAIALMSLGSQQKRLGNLEEAAEAYRRALEIRPIPSVYVGLAAVVYEQGDLNQAESWVHQALDLDSKHPESLNLLGLIYWQREDHEEAKRAFLAASRYDPYFLPAEKNLAGLLLETGHHGEALKIYQNILRRFGPFAGRKEIERIVQRLESIQP